MNENTRELLQAVEKVLLRCFLGSFVILFIWLLATLFMRDLIHSLHGDMFGLTAHELDLIFYCGMGLMKLAAFSLFLLPWLSIKMVLKKVA